MLPAAAFMVIRGTYQKMSGLHIGVSILVHSREEVVVVRVVQVWRLREHPGQHRVGGQGRDLAIVTKDLAGNLPGSKVEKMSLINQV